MREPTPSPDLKTLSIAPFSQQHYLLEEHNRGVLRTIRLEEETRYTKLAYIHDVQWHKISLVWGPCVCKVDAPTRVGNASSIANSCYRSFREAVAVASQDEDAKKYWDKIEFSVCFLGFEKLRSETGRFQWIVPRDKLEQEIVCFTRAPVSPHPEAYKIFSFELGPDVK